MKPFLTGEWKNLMMFNYQADAAALTKHLPRGTEVDTWKGNCYISLVGFMFLNTKVKGIRAPFLTNFEEVNLRFYVRVKDGNQWKRGVVFVKEIVPKRLISFVANTVYGEHYYCCPMRNTLVQTAGIVDVRYEWLFKQEWNYLEVKAQQQTVPLQQGSEEEFITEHFWGYTQLKNSNTSEYQVEHPRWNIHPVINYSISINTKEMYGEDFHPFLQEKPTSVFMAEGSPIKVYPRKLWKMQQPTT